jgi:aldehyde:ferredoxin oxidoreductase
MGRREESRRVSIYQGTALRVNLTNGEIRWDRTPENGIGGRTWNSVTLLRELEAGIDPLGPENLLCIAVGPLTGSKLSATCRFIASAKSPLTGILGDSGARGFFGPELRWAGIDQIVFSGASESWVYLHIDGDRVELRDAAHLAGLDITDTTVRLMDELGDPDLQVATIGPAGENLVKYAIISCNLSRACGRTGMGRWTQSVSTGPVPISWPPPRPIGSSSPAVYTGPRGSWTPSRTTECFLPTTTVAPSSTTWPRSAPKPCGGIMW